MKRKLIMIALATAMLCLHPYSQIVVHAENFAGNEDYYDSVCFRSGKDAETQAMCDRYRNFLHEKNKNLSSQVAGISSSVAELQGNIDALQTEINKNQGLIDQLEAQIAQNEAMIQKIQGVIKQLQVEIKQTEADIELRDRQIKDRMVSEQVSIGTNAYIEFIMGAEDLIDMVRIVDGISRITENDQDEIKALEEDKAKLDQQKKEQERLKADQEKTKQENEESKAVAEEAKASQEELKNEYLRQEADLIEQMRSAQSAQQAVESQIARVEAANFNFTASNGFIAPVQSGYRSAGTWAYPGGGFHAGCDFAASIGTPIYAPIGGVIVYANNPIPTTNGFFGNWVGYPAGGGNTVHMIGTVNGTTYAISFFHMAQENFLVSPGMAVSQGQQIGAVGNTGNSTGAHCHVEVFNLGNMSVESAVAQFSANGADFAWRCGWNTTSTSCASRGAPCRERPENFFG